MAHRGWFKTLERTQPQLRGLRSSYGTTKRGVYDPPPLPWFVYVPWSALESNRVEGALFSGCALSDSIAITVKTGRGDLPEDFRTRRTTNGRKGPWSLSPPQCYQWQTRSSAVGRSRPTDQAGPRPVWTALLWQVQTEVLQSWSVRPCVRPVGAARMTAGHNAFREDGSRSRVRARSAWARLGFPIFRYRP